MPLEGKRLRISPLERPLARVYSQAQCAGSALGRVGLGFGFKDLLLKRLRLARVGHDLAMAFGLAHGCLHFGLGLRGQMVQLLGAQDASFLEDILLLFVQRR